MPYFLNTMNIRVPPAMAPTANIATRIPIPVDVRIEGSGVGVGVDVGTGVGVAVGVGVGLNGWAMTSVNRPVSLDGVTSNVMIPALLSFKVTFCVT